MCLYDHRHSQDKATHNAMNGYSCSADHLNVSGFDNGPSGQSTSLCQDVQNLPTPLETVVHSTPTHGQSKGLTKI